LSEIEAANKSETFIQELGIALVRPISMTFKEPIIIAINLYIGYVYALLYSFFESFPIVYGAEGYGLSGGNEFLPFAALLVGEGFSAAGYMLWAWLVVNQLRSLPGTSVLGALEYGLTPCRYYYEPTFIRSKGVLNPEAALPMAIPGAVCLPVSQLPVRSTFYIYKFANHLLDLPLLFCLECQSDQLLGTDLCFGDLWLGNDLDVSHVSPSKRLCMLHRSTSDMQVHAFLDLPSAR
jgi:hypothetical protein